MSPKIFILSVLAILVCNIPGMLSEREVSQLVGCFKVVNMGKYVGMVVSIKHCLKKCQKYALPYAGVAFGVHCSCGGDLSKYKKVSSCTHKCLSNEGNCGGMGISSVYKVPKLLAGYIQKGYIGCYKEDMKNKVMPVDAGVRRSVMFCTDTCREKKMKFAGLRDGRYCHCGNKYDTHGKATDCTKKCETGEPCGGIYSYSVYEVLEPAQRPVQIGCFQEDNPRKLSKFVRKVSFMRLCFQKCLNYKYFGIENGSDCYCGNDYPKTVKSERCTKKCRFGGICGGDKALSVFKVLLDL